MSLSKKLLFVVLTFSVLTPLGYGFFRKVSLERADLAGVKIEYGGMIQLNQFMKRKYKHNGRDPYRVEFVCVPGKRKPKCQATRVNVLPITGTL